MSSVANSRHIYAPDNFYATELSTVMDLFEDPLAPFMPESEPEEIRVEWEESNVRVTGIVTPGRPSKLNTFGKRRV